MSCGAISTSKQRATTPERCSAACSNFANGRTVRTAKNNGCQVSVKVSQLLCKDLQVPVTLGHHKIGLPMSGARLCWSAAAFPSRGDRAEVRPALSATVEVSREVTSSQSAAGLGRESAIAQGELPRSSVVCFAYLASLQPTSRSATVESWPQARGLRGRSSGILLAPLSRPAI
jgi:hypothetical protein